MKIKIETSDDSEHERVTRLLQYGLSRQQTEIKSLYLGVEPVQDALGTRLNRCRLRARLQQGELIQIEELQVSLDLAVTRLLERCKRAVRRQTGNAVSF
ncbi:MAG: hypothetical protein KDI83_05520 [Gammaproteobacteria bacterium]|nr:hypothetical protein [Gammaproteobacteria bacterium]